MSFRNRCLLAGGNGVVNLSVPLQKGRDQKAPLRDIRVSYDLPWQVQQWRTIVSCYNRSPYFEYYAPWLDSFFQRKPVFLLDLNRDLTDWLWKVLKVEASRSESEGFVLAGETADGVKDLRGIFTPRNSFGEAETISYHQVFSDRLGFIPHLSILDLLFCEGPASRSILASHSGKP